MLWDAIRKESMHNVNVIIDANFPVDYPLNQLGMTALHYAAGTSKAEMIQLLLSKNPNVNSRDYICKFLSFILKNAPPCT